MSKMLAESESHPFLIAPEGPERPPHPDIKAAIGGNRAGQLADHQRRRQRPHDGQNQQNEDGARVSGFAEDVLNAVRAARAP